MRYFWIENLRFFAVLLVILIHSQGAFIGSIHGSENWWIFNIINSISHFSVPIFVMISGVLNMGKDFILKIFIHKRLTRILYPFLFWSFVLYIGNVTLNRPQSANNHFVSFVIDILTNNINPVYWFVYMILGLYLITPIFNKWLLNCKLHEVEYFLIFWMFTLLANYFKIFRIGLYLDYFSGFIGYYVLGYYLFKTKRLFFQKRLTHVLLVVIGAGITIFGNFFHKDFKFESYLTFNIMLLSSGVFLFFMQLKDQSSSRPIIFISKYSYGIYLIHAVFISLLSRVGINSLTVSPYLGSFIVLLLSLLFSLLVLYVLSTIPFVKRFIGV